MEDKKIEKLYLDYVNNFLTVDAFAEHYWFDIEKSREIIEEWRKINNSKD